MSTTELKGSLLNLIARVEDEAVLLELLTNFLRITQKVDMLDDMPDEAILALEQAIQESEDLSDAIRHDQVMQELRQWLDR